MIPFALDDVPWPAITAASGGWMLFGLCMFGLITGRWLVTRREADSYIKRAETAEAERTTLIHTLAGMTGVGKLQKKISELAIQERLAAGDDTTDQDEVG